MMFTVREMYHNPEFRNFKIVFITDRKELERQLSETSKSVGFTVRPARSVRELQELIKTDTPDLIMGMIHKFQERELKTEFPQLNRSPNILIMIDEAHRTQYKLLGANLRKALPNAVKIAYTGTPIERTEMTFGQYIDKYSIRQAVDDGVTVEIVYEGRIHSAELSDVEAANAKFEDGFYLLRDALPQARELFIEWYRRVAYEKISERVKLNAQKRGFKYNRVKVTSAQKRWGSSSSKGNLNFPWRLIMASLPVIDYVVIHELVHLEEKNHGKAFWGKVKMLMPDYEKNKDWLNKKSYLLKI